MTLYMKTTRDKYEFPIAVADTARELAEMVGTSQSVIYSSISHKHKGYCKVEIEEENESEGTLFV